MPPIPYRTYVRGHPGSSQKEIDNEPDWSSAKHHIGYRDRFDRVPGLVQSGDESDSEDSQDSFLKEAAEESDELQKDLKQHKLVNFREAKEKQEACAHVINTPARLALTQYRTITSKNRKIIPMAGVTDSTSPKISSRIKNLGPPI